MRLPHLWAGADGAPLAAGGAEDAGGDSSTFYPEPQVGLVFLVLLLDSNGAPIATSFYPYYGTSQKQLYRPKDENTDLYIDRCVCSWADHWQCLVGSEDY